MLSLVLVSVMMVVLLSYVIPSYLEKRWTRRLQYPKATTYEQYEANFIYWSKQPWWYQHYVSPRAGYGRSR